MREIKISVFGMDRVGKTALINRFLFDKFVQRYTETVEEIYRGDIKYHNQKCDITITDMGGLRQFPAMRKLAIQQSDGFFLVYSIDSLPSFKEIKRLYDIIVDVKGVKDLPILVVGNKEDIDLKRITPTDVSSSIKSMGKKVQRIETSAKTRKNVDVAFHRLIEMIELSKHEDVPIYTLKDMNRNSIRFSSLRSMSFSGREKTVHNIRIQSIKKNKRRRCTSSSSGYDVKTSTSYSTLSQILPATIMRFLLTLSINT